MSEKFKRIAFPKEVREYVFQRDNHQCQSCGQTAKLSIDHIIPLATGGSNDIRGCLKSPSQHFLIPAQPYFPHERMGVWGIE